ncbi:MAG: cytosine permease [Ornithinimicrobium sp.]
MTKTSAPAAGAGAPHRATSVVVEANGINVVSEAERTGKASDLFWPWFAANVSIFGMSYGSWVLDFGISFRQAVSVAVAGAVISFFFCGVVALAGKRGSAPTMTLSRAAFGVDGNKVPGVVSWALSIGWETVLTILATLATATIMERLGWGGGTATKLVAALVVSALIVTFAVLGYATIMRLQSILTWLTGGLSVLYIAMTVDTIDLGAVTAIPDGPLTAVIGAFILVMTGFGVGWINISSDYSRYLPRSVPGRSVIGWNTLGGSVAPCILVVFGLLLAGTSSDLREGISADPIGALASLLPTWMLIPFLVVTVGGLVSGAVLGIYSSGLTLLSLGVRIPRASAAFVDGTLLTLGTIYVVFFAGDFFGPFQGFLITLGVPIAGWAGVMMADITLRRRDYDEVALFDRTGRYGSVNPVAVGLMLTGTLVGWGLVVNTYAGWLAWQGYLLGPVGLGGRDGDWAWANVGVLASLVIGYLGYLALGRPAVQRQEHEV